MLKVIACPQCGRVLCRAQSGSLIEITCHNCKCELQGKVDKDGGVYALPLEKPDASKKKKG